MANNQSDELDQEKEDSDDPHYANTWAILISETLFVLLPLIVLTIVFSYQRKIFGLLHTPEWSFISAILFGQTLVKFVSAVISGAGVQYWQRVVAIVSAIIVLGIVPSLIILSLVLVSESPSNSLAIAQLVMFVLSIGLYFYIGGAGQYQITIRDTAGDRT